MFEGSQASSVCPSDKISEMKIRMEQCGMILTYDSGNTSTARQNVQKSSFYCTNKNIPSLNEQDPEPVVNSSGPNAKRVVGQILKQY